MTFLPILIDKVLVEYNSEKISNLNRFEDRKNNRSMEHVYQKLYVAYNKLPENLPSSFLPWLYSTRQILLKKSNFLNHFDCKILWYVIRLLVITYLYPVYFTVQIHYNFILNTFSISLYADQKE